MKDNCIAILALVILSSSLFSCISYRKRPARLYREVVERKETFDAAIVPGVPFENNTWDTVMKGRLLWAALLYKQGIIRNIIFSGGAVYSPYYEARIMGLYAQQMGIPADHIFYETRAEHSTENIFYAYQLARTQGFKSIALVTDPFQSSLLKGFTRKRFGTKIVHIPFIIDSLEKHNHIEITIDPSTAYAEHFKSIKERQGFFKRFRGTLGAFIPWEDRKKKAGPL